MIWQVMRAVYEVLRSAQIAGLKTLYEPGKPLGPFAQNLPAAVIVSGDAGEDREYPAADLVRYTLPVDIHVFTPDSLERAEQRHRGSYDTLQPLLEEIITALQSSSDLDGLVDELDGPRKKDTGPAHGCVRATYILTKRR